MLVDGDAGQAGGKLISVSGGDGRGTTTDGGLSLHLGARFDGTDDGGKQAGRLFVEGDIGEARRVAVGIAGDEDA